MGKKECGKKCQLNILPLGSFHQHPYRAGICKKKCGFSNRNRKFLYRGLIELVCKFLKHHDQFVEENGFVTFFLMYKLLPAAGTFKWSKN
jgi:hypothetical protein